MSNSTKVFCLVVTMLILLNKVSADDVKSPIVGEWTNSTNSAYITELKFFPNGLLTMVAKGNGWSARYKITSSSAPRSDIFLVNGYIKLSNPVRFADGDKQLSENKNKSTSIYDSRTNFAVKLTNHQKVMTLEVDNKGVKKEFMLFRTNDIKTGAIPAN